MTSLDTVVLPMAVVPVRLANKFFREPPKPIPSCLLDCPGLTSPAKAS